MIFRVDQNGASHPDNPFFPYCSQATSTTCTTNAECAPGTCLTQVARYLSYGVRNSFGLTLDPVTGSLWDTENGPNNYDEIDEVAPGQNSGWNRIMGPVARDSQGTSDLFNMPGAGLTYGDPKFSWLTTVAPTGIVFTAGSALGAAYDPMVLVGDSNNGKLYRLKLAASRHAFDFSAFPNIASDLVADSQAEADQLVIGTGFAGIVDLVRGPDGNVYVVSIGAGNIYRIRAATTPTPTPTGVATSTPTPTPTKRHGKPSKTPRH